MAAEVAEDYFESLQSLTVNSRPLIKTLTELASECIEFAPAVCDAIERHTQLCPPPMKLLPLYLVDSICKTEPIYAQLFESRIVPMFSAAFKVAPEPTRLKLSELFKTWTVGPLFSHDVLGQLNHIMNAPSTVAAHRPRLTQSVLMVQINKLRTLLQEDPDDSYNETQQMLLARCESEITGIADPKALPEMQARLDEIAANRERHLKSGTAGNEPRRRRRAKRQGPSGGVDKFSGTNNVPIGKANSNRIRGEKNTANLTAAITAAHAATSEASLSDLMGNLDATPEQISLLYGGLQCATCGFRFPDTEVGREAKQNEMDWHFRANKDIREGHSRSRCWFLTRKAWIAFRETDEEAPAEEEVPQIDFEAERQKYIDVPADATAVCPVCQEPHAVSWSEEAENWVWMNAVNVDGHYFHATCYVDPQNAETVAEICERKPF